MVVIWRYILSYGSSLTANKLACAPTTGYWCQFHNDPGEPPILPIDWLVYYYPGTYHATSGTGCNNPVNGVCQSGQYTYVEVAYYGVTNFIETWSTWVWAPLVAFLLYKKLRNPQTGLDKFGSDKQVFAGVSWVLVLPVGQ